MATAIRCTLPSCTCDCFAPGKSQIRTCEKCKHGWVAHALDKLTTQSLLPSLQVEVVHPNLVFDVASLMLYGTHAVPIRLKIILDRLFSVLQEDEVNKILSGLGWNKEDYARGYIVQDSDGKVLNSWICVLESEEGAIFNQFLRFGETRSIAEKMIQDLKSQRNTPLSQAKTESNIRTFIERMNRTQCQETFTPTNDVNSTQCAEKRDEGAYHQSRISNKSPPVPSSSTPSQLPDMLTVTHEAEVLESTQAKRRKHSSNSMANSDNVSVPSIHLANLERTVLNAGAEPRINSTLDVSSSLVPSDSPVSRIQTSVPQIRKRSSMSSIKSSHKSVLSRRRSKSAFTISASRKRVLCNVCSKWFYDKGTWKIHYSAVHLKVTYKCKVDGCNMVFSSLRSRNRHSVNPNPKIHRMVDAADDEPSRRHEQTSLSDAKLSKTSSQWSDVSYESDTAQENEDAKQMNEGEVSESYTHDDLIQENVDSSDASIVNLSKSHSSENPLISTQIDDKDSLSTKSLMAHRLPAPDLCIQQNTRTQKRKSNTPVRCLAVDDEEVKGHERSDINESHTEMDGSDENELSSKVSENESVEQASLDNEQEGSATVIKDANSAVCNQKDINMKEISELSVIKTSKVKSEYPSGVVVQVDDSDCHGDNSNGNHDNGFDFISRNTASPSDKRHPSVPPELVGFSPAVDQMGLNADNCFFTLDGFPTCILCQKSFQSRQGVKVHYQNVHLRMMHTCTVDGCQATFPSRRSRDRHSANLNLHHKGNINNNVNQEESDHESVESNSRQRLDINSEMRPRRGSDRSSSETNDSIDIKIEVDQNSNKSNSLPASEIIGDMSPITSPLSPVQVCNTLSPPPPEGANVKVESNARHCLPYESPTLVPPNHVASKLNLIDLWTGPRKSQGGLTCDICMKSYSTKDTLRTHYKNVHIREMHKCTVPGCEMMFSSVRSRNRHSQNPNLHRTYQDV